MAGQKHVIRQHDHSAGELVEHAKRGDDDPIVRAGLRQLKNMRILGTRKVENRPGRTALFFEEGRTDEVRMSATALYFFCFGDGTLKIRNSSGVTIYAEGNYLWTPDTAKDIVWTQIQNDVVITFPGQVPKIARWDGAVSWSFLDYAVATTSGTDHKRQPYYRFAPRGVSMAPGAATGTPAATFSGNVMEAGMVGVSLRYQGRRAEIGSFTSPSIIGLSIKEKFLGGQRLDFGTSVATEFTTGDVVINGTGAKGVISSAVGTTMDVTLQTEEIFRNSDSVVGPTGAHSVNTVAALAALPGSVIWDEELMSNFRGWPRSCFTDQARLGFCDFPGLPEAIVWSAVGIPDDLEPGSGPTDAIFELAPQRARVYHVAPAQDEFVLTDRGIWHIPISEASPLKPGSVAFRSISSQAAASLKPVTLPEGTLFVDAAKTGVKFIEGTGQTARPYIVRPISDYHTHLIKTPKALAVALDGPFAEPYAIVVNNDGTLAIGKYDQNKEAIGWLPWEAGGSGLVEWASQTTSSALLTVKYTPGGVTRRLIELLAPGTYLDGQITINSLTTPLTRIPSDVGTRIGNMTASGGLANGFDDKIGTTMAASPSRNAANGFIGKQFATPQKVALVFVYPTRDVGYANGGSGDVTIELRAKQTAPNADGSDGTLLGSIVINDTTSGPQQINSSDLATAWVNVWVRESRAVAPTDVTLSELQIFNPAGTRAIWPYAGGTVRLMDGLRDLGDRLVDGYGIITPQDADDLSVSTLVAGQVWEATYEPFLPHLGEGQSVGQTMKARDINFAVAFQQSTGFTTLRRRLTPVGEVWTWEEGRRVGPYKTGENQDIAPPQREGVENFTVQGSEIDPRVMIKKDTPGTLRILEFSGEIA